MCELGFDLAMPTTELALKYLKDDPIFKSTGVTDILQGTNEASLCTGTIEDTHYHVYKIHDTDLEVMNIPTSSPNETVDDMHELIVKEIDLVIQLEYLVRGISAEETMFNMKLIKSYADRWQKSERLQYRLYLYFDRRTPLSCIATLADTSYSGALILCTIEAAPIVRLLTFLLRQGGYSVDFLIVHELKSTPWVFGYMNKEATYRNNEFASGCIGVVTESADIDAAVHAFVSSFGQNPWKIQKVLVQENIYEAFKNTLKWKWERRSKTNEHLYRVQQNVQSKCTAVYQFNDNAFLFDYADTNIAPEMHRVTFVEAYRTDQELLSLLKKYSPFGLSVWCNDVSVANKIAHKADTSVTWINDYGYFEGCSNVFYNKIWTSNSIDSKVGGNPELCGLINYEKLKAIVTELKIKNSNQNLVNKAIHAFELLSEDDLNHNQIYQPIQDGRGQSVVMNRPRRQVTWLIEYPDLLRFVKILKLLLEGEISVVMSEEWCVPDIGNTNKRVNENSPLYDSKAIYTRFL